MHPDKDPQLFINEVSVIKAYQNEGIGRKLVKCLCKYGKELGCAEAWIATEKSNIPAQKAYLSAVGLKILRLSFYLSLILNNKQKIFFCNL